MEKSDITPLIYGLEFQARTICGLYTNEDDIRFAAGTQFIRRENQVHILTYSEEFHELKSQTYSHFGEIWGFSTFLSLPNYLVTTYLDVSDDFSTAVMKCHILKIPDNEHEKLDIICEIPTVETGNIKQILTCPLDNCVDIVALIDGFIMKYSSNGSSYSITEKLFIESKYYSKFNAGCWSPHHEGKTISTASDNNLLFWDLRSNKPTSIIENAHSQIIRDIDHNPNRQCYVITAGDDCKIKIWDLRKMTNTPLKEIKEHSHWVWKVKYNPFHDQLFLSSGSDSLVALHLEQSVSSEFHYKHLSDDDDEVSTKEILEDGVVQIYEEHEDSVYALDWSPVDPWNFASISYDGRLVFHQVPKNIKYGILL